METVTPSMLIQLFFFLSFRTTHPISVRASPIMEVGEAGKNLPGIDVLIDVLEKAGKNKLDETDISVDLIPETVASQKCHGCELHAHEMRCFSPAFLEWRECLQSSASEVSLLDLSRLNFLGLYRGTFEGMDAVSQLRMDQVTVDNVADNTFDAFKSLDLLSLRSIGHDVLKFIPAILKSASKIRSVDIAGGFQECDCMFLHMLKAFATKQVKVLPSPLNPSCEQKQVVFCLGEDAPKLNPTVNPEDEVRLKLGQIEIINPQIIINGQGKNWQQPDYNIQRGMDINRNPNRPNPGFEVKVNGDEPKSNEDIQVKVEVGSSKESTPATTQTSTTITTTTLSPLFPFIPIILPDEDFGFHHNGNGHAPDHNKHHEKNHKNPHNSHHDKNAHGRHGDHRDHHNHHSDHVHDHDSHHDDHDSHHDDHDSHHDDHDRHHDDHRPYPDDHWHDNHLHDADPHYEHHLQGFDPHDDYDNMLDKKLHQELLHEVELQYEHDMHDKEAHQGDNLHLQHGAPLPGHDKLQQGLLQDLLHIGSHNAIDEDINHLEVAEPAQIPLVLPEEHINVAHPDDIHHMDIVVPTPLLPPPQHQEVALIPHNDEHDTHFHAVPVEPVEHAGHLDVAPVAPPSFVKAIPQATMDEHSHHLPWYMTATAAIAVVILAALLIVIVFSCIDMFFNAKKPSSESTIWHGVKDHMSSSRDLSNWGDSQNYSKSRSYYPSQSSYYPSQSSYYPSESSYYPSQSSYYPSQSSYYPSQSSYYPSRSSRGRSSQRGSAWNSRASQYEGDEDYGDYDDYNENENSNEVVKVWGSYSDALEETPSSSTPLLQALKTHQNPASVINLMEHHQKNNMNNTLSLTTDISYYSTESSSSFSDWRKPLKQKVKEILSKKRSTHEQNTCNHANKRTRMRYQDDDDTEIGCLFCRTLKYVCKCKCCRASRNHLPEVILTSATTTNVSNNAFHSFSNQAKPSRMK